MSSKIFLKTRVSLIILNISDLTHIHAFSKRLSRSKDMSDVIYLGSLNRKKILNKFSPGNGKVFEKAGCDFVT